MRLRHAVLTVGSMAMVGLLLYTDPDEGLSTGMLMIGLGVCIVAVWFAHIARKAMFDYREADMQALFRKAAETPTGSGLALIALSIIIAALLMLFGSRVHAAPVDARTYIPPNANAMLPALAKEVAENWARHPAPETLAGLIEQESCVSLTSRRCWNPASSLKTSREEGAGLGQITRAFRADGSVRFDALADMRARHPALAEWSWGNVYQRADLQLRAVVLMNRENYQALARYIPNPRDTLAFADAAYNGGLGGVQADRRACGLKAGCDPKLWFGNVEQTCTKSRAPLYGARSACDINRDHVTNVMLVRSGKYRKLMRALT